MINADVVGIEIVDNSIVEVFDRYSQDYTKPILDESLGGK